MKRGRFHLKVRTLVAAAAIPGLAIFGITALAPTANAEPSCGSGKFVEKIEVVEWGDGQFQIVLTPTTEARKDAAFSMTPRNAVVEQWHAIQGCVPGLYGDLADTIWDQLECHQLNSWLALPNEGDIWLTGATYDLESWRPTLPRWVNGQDLIVTKCLNMLGRDPAPRVSSPFRPDTAQVNPWRNIA
ncbi:hypothetical protein GCM10023178_06710 [Actinomadura luteofluorescens]